MVGNPDYRESDFLDYKASFAFLEMEKGNPKREEKLAEFRSDVCSFANALGGYILYGISDDRGMAKEIIGIDIPNNSADQFELERKNNLNAIMPKIPSIKFRFIPLNTGKFIVVLFIQHDEFAPYVHREHEIDYRIWKRVGNGKQSINYVELRQMFLQSQSLDESIYAYRKERINYYRDQEDTPDLKYSRFMLLHIIPETFRDSSNKKNMFYLQRKVRFSSIFNEFGCNSHAMPNVDGLRYLHYRGEGECLLGNNGIAECFYSLNNSIRARSNTNMEYFASTSVLEKIQATVSKYIEIMCNVIDTKRIFIGVSILGCKGVATDSDIFHDYLGCIDRNTVICNPIIIQDISVDNDVERSIKLLTIEYALAIGVKYSETLNKLLDEVHHE